MNSSPSLGGGVQDPVLTPGTGVPVAPRGRRRDHVLAAAAGVVLTLLSLLIIGMAATSYASGSILYAVGLLVLMAALTAPAAALFATRSSAGGLAAGLTALAPQVVILLAPGHVVTISAPWAEPLTHTWMVLAMAGLWMGGAWGMHLARRGGHIQGRLAFRLTQADREVGSTPAPPPSRRRDHLASLPWVLGTLTLAAYVLDRFYAIRVDPGARPSMATTAAVLLAMLLLLAAGLSTGSSTLGVRVTGVLLAILSLPALLTGAAAEDGRWLLTELLPHGPGPVVTTAIALTLAAIGWGAHAARRQGRSTELAELRTVPAP